MNQTTVYVLIVSAASLALVGVIILLLITVVRSGRRLERLRAAGRVIDWTKARRRQAETGGTFLVVVRGRLGLDLWWMPDPVDRTAFGAAVDEPAVTVRPGGADAEAVAALIREIERNGGRALFVDDHPIRSIERDPDHPGRPLVPELDGDPCIVIRR
jgi:hypothetical protein